MRNMPSFPAAPRFLKRRILEMNRMKRHILSLTVVIVLLAIPTFAVLAKELGSLTVSGPGIKGQITMDHEGGIRKLETSGFFDSFQAIKPPENLGEGYTITANLNLDGKTVPYIRMVYYPTPAGEPAYVHYTGRLDGESLRTVDEWGQLSADADTALRGLMDYYGVALQSALLAAPAAEPAVAQPAVVQEAAPAVVPVTSSAAPVVNPYLVAGLATALLVLIGIGLALKRRGVSQPSV
jgi:hypothetical protein